eukprot:UN04339
MHMLISWADTVGGSILVSDISTDLQKLLRTIWVQKHDQFWVYVDVIYDPDFEISGENIEELNKPIEIRIDNVEQHKLYTNLYDFLWRPPEIVFVKKKVLYICK